MYEREEKITKIYVYVLLVLTLVSALTLFFTAFVNAFTVIGVDEVGEETVLVKETAMYYLGSFLPDSVYAGISEDAYWMFNGAYGYIIVAFAVVMTVVPLYTLITRFKYIFKAGSKSSAITRLRISIWTCLVINIVYYLFCLYGALNICDFYFEVFFSSSLVTTDTYKPLIVQTALLVLSIICIKLWNKTLAYYSCKGDKYHGRDTVYCPYCSYPVTLDRQSCPNCGTRLTSDDVKR